MTWGLLTRCQSCYDGHPRHGQHLRDLLRVHRDRGHAGHREIQCR
jgi:hypothetical protein